MQLTSSRPVASTTGTLLASQTIDSRVKNHPHSGVTMWSTDREYRLAGARDGIDTFTSVDDAVRAASVLSAGEMPGLAVVTWRGGYRLHDVHTASRSYVSTAAHDWMPDFPMQPSTRLYARSSVPFAAGNVRPATADGAHTPAVVRAASFVALVDGSRAFVPQASTWAGKSVLVETEVPANA